MRHIDLFLHPLERKAIQHMQGTEQKRYQYSPKWGRALSLGWPRPRVPHKQLVPEENPWAL